MPLSSKSWKTDFNLDPTRLYLNCAGQGPLCQAAVEAVRQALLDKQSPHDIDMNYGYMRAEKARQLVSQLISHDPNLISLANSTGWGNTVLSQALLHSKYLKPGDEVIVFEGQFPSNIAPWQILESQGVKLVRVPAPQFIADVDRFTNALSPRTRVASLEWVHFMSGDQIPIDRYLQICKERGIFLIVDATQGVGALPFSMKDSPVDALICSSYKWMAGPYGSGFMALSPRLLDTLGLVTANWLCFASVQDGRITNYKCDPCQTARRFDIFAHMGFLNLDGLLGAAQWLLDQDCAEIAAHRQKFDTALDEGFQKSTTLKDHFVSLRLTDPARQSWIYSYEIRGMDETQLAKALKASGIAVTVRQGVLRISPYLYNEPEEIPQLLSVLQSFC